jgi:aquaporin Z
MSVLRAGWRAYACEAAGLAGFLFVVGVVDALVFAPQSPFDSFTTSDWLKRLVVGLAAGGYLIALVYSPFGKESGAHINPSVTLAFLRMGKIARVDACMYIAFQFAGAVAGVLLFALVMPAWASDPQVDYIVTKPGPWGYAAAFVAEFAITFGMVLIVLESSSSRLARFTGLLCGTFLAFLIVFESPISGTSLNPARSTGSAVIAEGWYHLFLYFIAPPLGAQFAVIVYRRGRGRTVACAKLHHHAADHPATARCIMKDCGFREGATTPAAQPAPRAAPRRRPSAAS